MYIYKFLFFITLGDFLEGKRSKQSQIKDVIYELLIKGHNKSFANETEWYTLNLICIQKLQQGVRL